MQKSIWKKSKKFGIIRTLHRVKLLKSLKIFIGVDTGLIDRVKTNTYKYFRGPLKRNFRKMLSKL